MDTIYDSEIYVAPIESYDVDLSWDDLHWVFVYEGDITNPVRKVWLTKENYDTLNENSQQPTLNDKNGEILDNINNLASPGVNIVIQNNSSFALDVSATIEQIANVANYTNAAGLQIGVDLGENTTYASEASVSALSSNTDTKFIVKPTATRFVNNTGNTANVTGEVNLTFTKSN